jgi:hypothetical protein
VPAERPGVGRGRTEARGPRPARRPIALAVLAYCTTVVVLLLLESPRLLAARQAVPFPPVSFVHAVPVAIYGIYFYTGASVAVGLFAARFRAAGWADAGVLSLLGVAGYEAVYGTTYALLQGSPGLLLPAPGLPLSGWAGLASWGLFEGLVASLAIYRWRWWGLDRSVGLAVAGFLVAMIVWKVTLDLSFPPYETNGLVYPINTAAEIAGSLWIPLIATARHPFRKADRIGAPTPLDPTIDRSAVSPVAELSTGGAPRIAGSGTVPDREFIGPDRDGTELRLEIAIARLIWPSLPE